MDDFCTHYNQMSFCHRVEGKHGTVVTCAWTSQNAGGCEQYPDSYMFNPQVQPACSRESRGSTNHWRHFSHG